jgi:hypothetical protein
MVNKSLGIAYEAMTIHFFSLSLALSLSLEKERESSVV